MMQNSPYSWCKLAIFITLFSISCHALSQSETVLTAQSENVANVSEAESLLSIAERLKLKGAVIQQDNLWYFSPERETLYGKKPLSTDELEQLLRFKNNFTQCSDCSANPIPLTPKIQTAPITGESAPIPRDIEPPKCAEDEILIKGKCMKISDYLKSGDKK